MVDNYVDNISLNDNEIKHIKCSRAQQYQELKKI